MYTVERHGSAAHLHPDVPQLRKDSATSGVNPFHNPPPAR